MKVLVTVCWNRRETGLARNEEQGVSHQIKGVRSPGEPW